MSHGATRLALWLLFFIVMPRNLFLLFALLVLVSCGEDSKHFKIEGRLLQMNQGEFYVYSNDQCVNGIDTIKVQGGRFSYEIPCSSPSTLTIVFPNFSETPVFAEPGKKVKVDGDASHLKMLKIKGTKDNELMTSFREHIATASPPEIKRYVEVFINDHADSPVAIWLLRKYFIATSTPDYAAASKAIKALQKKLPDNAGLKLLAQSVEKLKATSVGNRLPAFTTYDINGSAVSSSDLSVGTAVILVWATWSYDSSDMMRHLQELCQTTKLKVLAINVDPSKFDCRSYIKSNEVTFPVVCTGDMFDTPVLKQLGLQSACDLLLVKDGIIKGVNLSPSNLDLQLGK